jgi:rod shape-determining protein MreC
MAISRPGGSRGSRNRLAILLLASVTLLTFGVRDVPVVRDAREGVGSVLQPVVDGVQAVTRPIGNAWDGVTSDEGLEAENRRLRRELDEAEARAIAGDDAEQQMAELTRAVDLPYLGDIPTVAARVVSGPRSNFSHAVEISKGTDDGLAEGMPVVTGAGLVGRIIRVTGTTATVEMITDPQFRVGVRVVGSGFLGTAEGRGLGEEMFVDTGIDPDSEVVPGTPVVTSGVDRSAYPAGIPVAKTTESRKAPGGLALELEAKPLVDVDALSYVTVLRWEPPA